MSDNPASTPITPTEPAAPATTPAAQGGSPTPGAQTPAATTQPQTPAPFKEFATEDEFKSYVASEVSKTAAKIKSSAARSLARDYGFEDADELREWLATQRQGQSKKQPGTPDADPTPASQGPSEVERLQMAIRVGGELGLPVTLLDRLRGDTEEAMKADAQLLLATMSSGNGASTALPRAPGIPPPPSGNQPVTFTTTQLKDAEFVRNNAAAIQQAAREGRIVRS